MGTPIRWLLMIGIAACGYFAIMGNDINTRMMAFVVSAIIWQMHSVVLMWEADLFAAVKRKKLEKEIQTLKESMEQKESVVG
ncbi:MAG: hypothetical protein QW568_04535 [Candidatus Anstonellaceae archaeon]